MAEYIRLYELESEFQDKRENDYFEPWVSLTVESNNRVDYNKTKEEKLLGSYLTFKITGDGNIRWHADNANQTRVIQYKKNDGEWTTITSATGNSAPSIAVVSGDTVQFRGDNPAYGHVYNTSYGDIYANSFSGSSCGFEAYGNIMSLIDSDDFANATAITANAAFAMLFFQCTGLTSVSDLMLPAKTLSGYTYRGLFNYCSSLTDYPRIYAETLDLECMRGLFYYCTSLTGVPKDYLPWLTVPKGAYSQMFLGCSSLVAAPDLPGTTTEDSSYVMMFNECTSLTNTPTKMAATTAGYRTMASMFQDCTSLTGVPADFIQVTSVSSNTFEAMFKGCTALTHGPEIIPAPALSGGTCVDMFSGCTSLLNAPQIIATELGGYSCGRMFQGCSSLVSVQSVLPATVLSANCYNCMFKGCTSLTGAPELPAATVPTSGYSGMFSGCTSLLYIKCLATNISAAGAVYAWVDGVPTSSNGVFVKAASMSSWPRGVSGIPNYWSIQDAT